MAITNLNPYLWIRIYTGFDIKPNLRQTGTAKTWPLLCTCFCCEVFSVNLFTKKN